LIGWGKPVIARWMGTAYQDAYWPLVVLSFAVLLDVCQKPSIDLLYATYKHRFYTYLNWGEGLLNLGFSLALARPLGILGVALGTLIGAVVIRLIAQPWWVCKVCGFRYLDYMRFVLRNLAMSGGLMTVSVLLAFWGLRPEYPLLAASAIVATLIYGLGTWLLIFDERERGQLLATISRIRTRDDDHVRVSQTA